MRSSADIFRELVERKSGTPVVRSAEEIAAEQEADRQRFLELQREARQERADEFYLAVCPTAYRATNFDDPRLAHNRDQIDTVLQWSYGPRGLLLSGPSRSGKTRAMWGLLRRLILDELRAVRFLHGQELSAEIAGAIRYGAEDALEGMQRLARAPILAIDDLGQGMVSASQQDRVDGWLLWLFDQRLAWERPTICTTNLSAASLGGGGERAKFRHDPLIARLVESCQVLKFTCP